MDTYETTALFRVGVRLQSRSPTYVQPLKKRIIFFSLFGLYYFMIWKSVATALSANGRHGRIRSS